LARGHLIGSKRITDQPLVPTLLNPKTGQMPDFGQAERTLRIAIVSQYFPPEIGATQTRIQSFAEFLAARGHRVTVISEFPNHPHGVIPAKYVGHLMEDDRSNPYRVLRVWVKANPEKTQATRMAFYLSYMTLATAVAPLVGKADVVVATTPPLFTGAAGMAIATLYRAPLVLDVRDLWPAAAISLGQISNGRALHVAEFLERTLYRRAAVVLGVTRPFCDHVDRIRRKKPDAVLLPNGTLDMFLTNSGNGSLRRRFDLPTDRFVVTFAGTHGIAQALPSVLDAAERLPDEAHFALFGDGPIKNHLVESAERRGLANVSFHPQLPLEQIPPALTASDALLVPLSAHPTFESFVPSKLFDFMAARRPVIVAAAGEATRILERAQAGVAVPPENPDALTAAVRWLRAHPREAAEMGNCGRTFARGRLREVQAERLERVLLDAAARR
jgi:glycosyltransferase involved in cell wall biosynthesis